MPRTGWRRASLPCSCCRSGPAMRLTVRGLAIAAGLPLVLGCRAPDAVGVHLSELAGATENPGNSTGDEDNLAGGFGVSVRAAWPWSVQADCLFGDYAADLVGSVGYGFELVGPAGPGAIDGRLGIGFSFPTDHENTPLGNRWSPVCVAGLEAPLHGSWYCGGSLVVAVTGYDESDAAMAGLLYFGRRF